MLMLMLRRRRISSNCSNNFDKLFKTNFISNISKNVYYMTFKFAIIIVDSIYIQNWNVRYKRKVKYPPIQWFYMMRQKVERPGPKKQASRKTIERHKALDEELNKIYRLYLQSQNVITSEDELKKCDTLEKKLKYIFQEQLGKPEITSRQIKLR